MGYPPPYYDAWDKMTEKPWAWGLAPIHHGCFENGWRGAILAVADLVNDCGRPDLASKILELGIYTEDDEQALANVEVKRG